MSTAKLLNFRGGMLDFSQRKQGRGHDGGEPGPIVNQPDSTSGSNLGSNSTALRM